MKKILLLNLVMLSLGFLILKVNAQSEKSTEVLNKMRIANDYFMNKWPDPGKSIITNRERPSNIWTRAVYYEGLMALYSIDSDKKYYQYAVDWATFHKWGFRSGNTTRNADDQCCAQTYIDLYNIEPNQERIENTKICLENLLASDKIDDWSWVDAIQMGMPVFAKMGALLNDSRYYSKMFGMYQFTRNKHGDHGLFNPKDGLWWRDKDFDPPYTEPNGQDCYWSRGNGWVYLALARVMDITGKNNPYYKNFLKDYLTMTKALVKVQREDGTWNVSLHDPGHFGGMELSGTAMFIYGMAWGINNGELSEKKYKPVIEKAWNALVNNCMHEDGFLGYVQGTGKEPKDGQPVTYTSVPDFEDYALGAFLLAGTEMYNLYNK